MIDDKYLTLATNWDNRLIKALGRMKLDSVRELWGTLNFTPIGSGREPAKNSVYLDDAAEHIKLAREAGLNFCYLLNAACTGNQEYLDENKKEIFKHLEWLSEAGANFVTIANPYIMKLVLRHFPNLKIKASVIMEIDNLHKLSHFIDLGCETVVLSYNRNRDFNLIRAIPEHIQPHIELLTSDICLFNCPYRYYHYNQVSHESSTLGCRYSRGNRSTPWYKIYYPVICCTLKKCRNPEELIRSRWIRPEDISVYAGFGIRQFKIGTRNRETDWLLRAAKAYNDESYEGNLFHLLADNTPEIPGIEDFASVFVDNSRLDGFLAHFVNKDTDCANTCDITCTYCRGIAERALEIKSPEKMKKYEKALDVLMKKISDSPEQK